jgi:hypothetical protein
VAEIDLQLAARSSAAHRDELPARVREQLVAELTHYEPADPRKAPTGEDHGGRL